MYKKKLKTSNITGLLGVESQFDGEIQFEGILRIDGHLTGRIVCKDENPSTVIITEKAVVDAEIIADVVIISGKSIGNVLAIERVEIHAPGRLQGKIYTCDMVIEEGALFHGECVMLRHLTLEEKRDFKYDGINQRNYEKKLFTDLSKAIEL